MRSPIRTARLWWWLTRRNFAAARSQAQLREFVYLDEVSVFSLIASRLGPIAAEFTETQTNSLKSEIKSTLSAGGAGIAKAELGGTIGQSQDSSTQVMRKSTVQTTFKELRDHELTRGELGLATERLHLPRINGLDDLLTRALDGDVRGWVKRAGLLSRGSLVEVECELSTEPIFQFNAVVAAMLGLVGDDPNLRGSIGNVDLATTLNRILDELLVGLVPVRGRVLDYRLTEHRGEQWLVHRDVIAGLPPEDLAAFRDVYIVGVTERSLYWKDIRRVLFEDSRYRMLCRISREGIQPEWTSVKLLDVLGDFFPDISSSIQQLGPSLMQQQSPVPTTQTHKAIQLRVALRDFAHGVALDDGAAFQGVDVDGLAESVRLPDDLNQVAAVRGCFKELAGMLQNAGGLTIDPASLARMRDATLAAAGIDLVSQALRGPTLAAPVVSSTSSTSSEALIETEIVAIYW